MIGLLVPDSLEQVSEGSAVFGLTSKSLDDD